MCGYKDIKPCKCGGIWIPHIVNVGVSDHLYGLIFFFLKSEHFQGAKTLQSPGLGPWHCTALPPVKGMFISCIAFWGGGGQGAHCALRWHFGHNPHSHNMMPV